ncbi:unnamed protein product [Psylliodes chrysocephalus]|uniref:Protein sleepless n=1 Tax=Psylliodes chrysocephalus TaxID=3402493 RepID=A0A9P0G3E1_9CUCU|nr:unnamed protein product [Psylliodes chrysocephala]
MSLKSTFFIFITLFLTISVDKGFSIKCWDCRSDLDPNCGDQFTNVSVVLSDCSLVSSYDWQGNEVDPHTCLKIVQKGNGKTVTIRRCAFLNEFNNTNNGECTWKEGTDFVALETCRPNECNVKTCSSCSTEYCSCNSKDACNSSMNLNVSCYVKVSIIFFICSCYFSYFI